MYRRAKVINVVLLAVWCLSLLTSISLAAISAEELEEIAKAVPEKARVRPNQPRKLLVFNLCNGFKHKSIPYWDKALEIMGRKTGAFEAVISSDMSMFERKNLNQFDAVCFNNTTKLIFEPALRKSLMDFIKGGKGIVGIHAATDNFYDWPEAAEMMGGQFCGHPWRANGTWAIKIDEPEHPLMAAFKGKGFKINDEIYRTRAPLYSRAKQRVLMSLDMTDEATRNAKGVEPSDTDIGISWVKSYGKGRLFYCSLGHNPHLTWNPAVLQHYLDGIQFALGDLLVDTRVSTQKQSDDLLARIATYNYGQSRIALTELTELVRSTYDSTEGLKQIERRFLTFLRSDATLADKQFICRQLSIIGTEEAAPTLAAMLTEASTADMARYALEQIPGSAVDKTLRDALGKTSGKVKVGIINSLGERGDIEAVEALSKELLAADYECVSAATTALGKIGGKKAARALKEMLKRASGNWRVVLADAYLMCADKFLADGDKESALEIYRQMQVAEEPEPIRVAALRGIVTTAGEKAVGVIVGILTGKDQAMQTAAIELIRKIPGTRIIKAAAAELPNLSVASQVQLLSALADRGDPAAHEAVVAAARSKQVEVRIAALEALAILGDASSVELLADAATRKEGAEQQAARESLYRLRGPEVDQAIVGSIRRADAEVKVELIRSIGARKMSTAAEVLTKTAKDSEARVRLESIKVLKDIAEEKHLPALLELLMKAQSEGERKEAEKTVVAVANKIGDKNRRAEAVLAVLPSVKDIKARCSLLGVLGRIGDSNALGVLREALEDNNAEVQAAAVRALSDWPTAEPMAELLKVVQTSDNKIHKVLALRGFIRLIGLESERPSKETVKLYSQAMELSSDAGEKRMVLSGLATMKSFAALEIAASYLDDKALQREAEAAVVKIAEATGGKGGPEETRRVLQKVMQISSNDSLRKRARKVISEIK